MRKLFIISLILAIVMAVGWEVLSNYESRYTGLVLYGHLLEMNTMKEFSLESEKIITQAENELVVMQFEGKPAAPKEPDFYTAKLMDANGNFYKLQTAIWDEKKPAENYLVFAVPQDAKIERFLYADQQPFPVEYFHRFSWLRYRHWLGLITLILIALAIVLGIVKHFKGEEKKEDHVDPFDFMNKPKAA